MVLYSVLALSSRHRAFLLNQRDDEASFYHGKCLGLVIDALSNSETLYDDNLLSTVTLLRVYEEIDETTDEYLHLRGMGRLMTKIPTFAHSGGLAEAACWQSLRQDIFVALVSCQPPTFNLDSYELSSAFTFRDEGACANVIVLLFAKVLKLVHSPGIDSFNEQWTLLEGDVERWNERRMRLFQPVYEEELDLESGSPFPIVCMMNPPQGNVFSRETWHFKLISMKLSLYNISTAARYT